MAETTEYSLNEAQMLCLTMLAPEQEAENAAAARSEMIEIIKAWRRGRLLPGSETPILNGLYAELR
jgi:hypothetical protein